MRGFRAIALVAVSVLFGWTLATPAKAALIKKYTYTGNTFDQVSGVFTTNDRVTGYFVIDCGLFGASGDCANIPYSEYRSSIGIIDYSFSAGPLTLGPSTSDLLDFEFSTGSNMLIDNWLINVEETFGTFGSNLIRSESSAFDEANIQPDCFECEGGSFGSIFGNPGNWAVEAVSVPVPAPATPYLFPSALVVLIALSRRRRPSSL